MFKLTNDTLRVFGAHLKASTGSANVAARAAEVDSLRKYTNSLPLNSQYVVVGDFNIYSANEEPYKKLLDSVAGSGHFIDPLKMTGTFNNIAYAKYHTQSPRVRSFQGGATGGLDDRFDYILYSKAISSPGSIDYIEGSTTAYGNDGKHYNDSINRMPNDAVSPLVANALHYASDHIPVFAKFSVAKDSVSDTTGVSITDFDPRSILTDIYPNPASTYIKVPVRSSGSYSITMYDLQGRVAVKFATTSALSIESYTLKLDPTLRAGLYTIVVSNGKTIVRYKVAVVK